jgi:hypothetical protein
MVRRFLLVSALCTSLSVAVFAQKGGSSGSAGSAGSTSGAGPAGAPGTAVPGGTPTTAGTIGGLAGQASSGTVNPPSGNTGIPTVPETMGGPAGNTGSNQGNPADQNTFPAGVNNSGFIGASAGGVLATPSATFASPSPTAGISDSGRAGVTDSTPVNTGVTSTTENSTLVYTNAPAINPRAAVNPASLNTGRLINDFGPSVYVGETGITTSAVKAASVADIAARYKAQSPQNAKTITNSDVERMLGNGGNSGGGGPMASNMPPSDMPQAPQNGSPAATSASQANTQAAPSTSAIQQSAPATSQSHGAASEANTSGSNASGTNAAANAPANANNANAASSTANAGTTPQVNPNQSQSGDQESNRLPATSTFLPLLGLLGIASSGAGLWYRKFRK